MTEIKKKIVWNFWVAKRTMELSTYQIKRKMHIKQVKSGKKTMKKGIRIYNLYPRFLGNMENWIKEFDRIKNMNFNWIYLNPFQAPGFSGSDYSLKNYYHYNPLYVNGKMDFSNLENEKEEGNRLLKKVCSEAEKRGMKVMMDLVVNHTAIDSELIEKHSEWFDKNPDGTIKKPSMPGDNGEWIEWGDLAIIDHFHTKDRKGLYKYWLDVVLFYINLGIKGFRCDAVPHVPSIFWKYLIPEVKKRHPEVVFIAESVGCQTIHFIESVDRGFDYPWNSFKWWDFKQDWFLKDFSKWAGMYSSVAFPENHDTTRCAVEINGNKDIAIMRYGLAAYFCSSVMTTIGFEYGFKRKIDVVKTDPSWYLEEKQYDISEAIGKINKIKEEHKILQEDNMIEMVEFKDESIIGFTKEGLSTKGKIFVLANSNNSENKEVEISNIYALLGTKDISDVSHGKRLKTIKENMKIDLMPGELKLFIGQKI